MIRKMLLAILGVSFALFLALFVHIWIEAGKPPKHLAGTQLARIDLLQPVDSLQAMELRGRVQALKGVSHCYVNVPAGTLVYSYTRSEQTSAAVYAAVAAFSPVPCSPFTVDAADLATSCPAMEKSGFYYSFSAWVRKLRGRNA